MLSDLDKQDRLRLMKFVCSLAWADLKIADQERSFIHKLVKRLKLDASDQKQIEAWLELPPRAEEVDPNEIPREHRKLFLDLTREVTAADGDVSEEERETLGLLETMLSG
jgi:uncharacterized tellurite resistance protein B-like protein